MDKVNFEMACQITGKNPKVLPGVDSLTEISAKRVIAGYKLDVINEAINIQANFKPDFSEDDQWKYTPWVEWSASAGGFVFTCTAYTDTTTRLGARFWFADRNTALKFAEDNIELINDLHRIG